MPPKKGAKNVGKAIITAAPVKEPTGDGTVIVLPFSSMAHMAAGLARVSAYLEDPEYEGRPISLFEIGDLNIPAKRYAGHNFPLQTYDQTIGLLGTLSNAEKIVQRAITEVAKKVKDRKNAYVVAYVDGDLKTLEHEKQHATFYFCPDYQQRVAGIWKSVESGWSSWAKEFHVHLGKMYCERVWLDEFQAIVLNREYECATKVVQLLQSVVPKIEQLPYHLVTVKLPEIPLEQAEENKDAQA